MNQKAKEEFGFKPIVDLETGVERTIEWMRGRDMIKKIKNMTKFVRQLRIFRRKKRSFSSYSSFSPLSLGYKLIGGKNLEKSGNAYQKTSSTTISYPYANETSAHFYGVVYLC